MAYVKKTILLLFAEPSVAARRDGASLRSRGEAEVETWLAGVPELSLVANVRAVHLPAMSAQKQPELWQVAARTIGQHYRSTDGFVLVQPASFVPYTAAALALMLQNLGKPVIVAGSLERGRGRRGRPSREPEWGEIGMRANLVNAVQFATLDIGEVAVLDGNALYRGSTYTPLAGLQSVQRAEQECLGRIDFGLRLIHGYKRRAGTALRLRTALRPHIVHIVATPGIVAPAIEAKDARSGSGILFSLNNSSIPPELITLVRSYMRRGIAAGIFLSPAASAKPSGFYLLHGMTSVMAVVKFMWVLGQERRPASIQQLLDTDCAGEYRGKGIRP